MLGSLGSLPGIFKNHVIGEALMNGLRTVGHGFLGNFTKPEVMAELGTKVVSKAAGGLLSSRDESTIDLLVSKYVPDIDDQDLFYQAVSELSSSKNQLIEFYARNAIWKYFLVREVTTSEGSTEVKNVVNGVETITKQATKARSDDERVDLIKGWVAGLKQLGVTEFVKRKRRDKTVPTAQGLERILSTGRGKFTLDFLSKPLEWMVNTRNGLIETLISIDKILTNVLVVVVFLFLIVIGALSSISTIAWWLFWILVGGFIIITLFTTLGWLVASEYARQHETTEV